jgi:hypothetical protein
MRYLILSLDYEIFGNGEGDVMQHVVHPTEAMAKLCERHHVPLTIFFEVEEYLAFAREAITLRKLLAYDPAQCIREQIVSLSARGHDVQLHLHPEWHGSRLADGQWTLHPEQRTVDDLFETPEETVRYIASRKAVIEDLLPSHAVTAYRAGAFCARPGRKLLGALAANNFVLDSSVVKGLADPDYSKAPSGKGPWRIRDDVIKEEATGPLWEFPIYAVPGRRFQQATISRLRAKFSRNVPRARQKAMMGELGLGSKNPLRLVKFLFQAVPLKLDYHNIRPHQLLQWVRSAPAAPEGAPDVLVFIGHSKEQIDEHAFEQLLQLIADDPDLRVISFDDLAQLLKNANHHRHSKSCLDPAKF